MNSKRLFYVLTACLCLLLLGLFGVAYGANKFLTTEAHTLAAAKANSNALDDQQRQLAKDKSDITRYSELSDIAATVVPQDKDQAQAVREIVNLAAASNIPQLSSIVFPASSLGAASTGVKTPNGITQVTPVSGITGVYDLQITVTLDATHAVSYDKFISFLQKLEQNRRTAQVSSVNVQPNADNPSLISFSLVIDEYIKP